jgi:hypothetical protein
LYKEILVKKIVSMMAILLFTGAVARGEPANLLLGKWKLSAAAGAPAPSAYCVPTMEFAAKSYIRPDANGKPSPIPVTYVTGETTTFPTVVYVMTDAGIEFHTTYRFLSKNNMILDTALQCPYVRQ